MTRDDQPPMDAYANHEWLISEYPDSKMQVCRAVALGEWWIFVGQRRHQAAQARNNPPQPDASCPEG